MDTVNLSQKFSLVRDYWSPKIVGELNDSYVKVVKLQGEFVWHHNDHEDEMFLVVKGCLFMGLLDAEDAHRAAGTQVHVEYREHPQCEDRGTTGKNLAASGTTHTARCASVILVCE